MPHMGYAWCSDQNSDCFCDEYVMNGSVIVIEMRRERGRVALS